MNSVYIALARLTGTTTNSLTGTTDVKLETAKAHTFLMEQNYPNPFNPSTTINYEMPSSGKVSIKIFNVMGKEVGTLADEYQSAGVHEVKFQNASLPSGAYFYRLQAGDYVRIKKMVLMK